MPNAWTIRFDPNISFLVPTAGGNFSVVSGAPGKQAPPANSFPVVTSTGLTILDKGAGPPPVPPGAPARPATIEFVGRAVSKPGDPQEPFVSLGTVKGTAVYVTVGGVSVPLFRCQGVTVGTVKQGIDFSESTAPIVARSDWTLRIQSNPPTFDTNLVQSFEVRLPWKFVDNPGRLQLSARLTVNGVAAADENVNKPLDIPLKHDAVPEDAVATKKPFPFFGLGNLYSRANVLQPNPRVPFRLDDGQSINVIAHSSLDAFCQKHAQKTDARKVLGVAADILADAGFQAVNILAGAKADQDCDRHWRLVDRHFMSLKIRDPDQSQPNATKLEFRFADEITRNPPKPTVQIPDAMAEIIPFFHFYVFVEDFDPPGNELAHSEGRLAIPGSSDGILVLARMKAMLTPIVISAGTSSSNPLRKLLSIIDPDDHVNVLASTICHEIGHTFGLRHAVGFNGAPPYRPVGVNPHGAMAPLGVSTSNILARFPPQFFGPVHVPEIQRLFL